MHEPGLVGGSEQLYGIHGLDLMGLMNRGRLLLLGNLLVVDGRGLMHEPGLVGGSEQLYGIHGLDLMGLMNRGRLLLLGNLLPNGALVSVGLVVSGDGKGNCGDGTCIGGKSKAACLTMHASIDADMDGSSLTVFRALRRRIWKGG
nr:hypothetical protein [Tanacetum cinerariifolium]